MASENTESLLFDIFKDMPYFGRSFVPSNKIDSNSEAQDCTKDSSNLDPPSRKRFLPKLSLFARAKRIFKMEPTDDVSYVPPTEPSIEPSTDPLMVPPTLLPNVRLQEYPVGYSFCSSDDSTPNEIGRAVAVPIAKVKPDAATKVHYKRARAYATVGQNGSPIPRKPVSSSPSASPSIRASLGPTMRTSRDAYQVIMGENPAFPARSSSLPLSPPSRTLPRKASMVVSRLSRPTAASSARAVNTSAIKHTNGAQTSGGARSSSASITRNAANPTRAVKSLGAATSIHAARSPRSIPATRSASASKQSSASAAKTTPALRNVNSTRTAARSTKMMKPTGVTRTASVRRIGSAKAPTRPMPRTGTINSFKSAGKGFKSRISAIITNRGRPAGIYQYGSGQELSPLIGKDGKDGKDGVAESAVKRPNKKPALSLPSSPPNADTDGEDVDNFLSMSRDQLDRLIEIAHEIHDKDTREGAMNTVQAYGEALVAVTAARKANMNLSAAIVSLSREATELGIQALATLSKD